MPDFVQVLMYAVVIMFVVVVCLYILLAALNYLILGPLLLFIDAMRGPGPRR